MSCWAISVGACLVGLLGVMVAEFLENLRLRCWFKITASLGMLAFALCVGGAETVPGKIFVAGVAVSVVGDVFLVWSKTHFLQGIGAFLLAHCLYAAGFLSLGVDWAGVGFAVVLLAPITWIVWRWLYPHTGRLKWAIAAYLVAISAMASLSIGALWDKPGQGQQVLLVAAALFCISDLFVARDKFIVSQHRNVWIGLPIYYLAQLGIGLGAGLL